MSQPYSDTLVAPAPAVAAALADIRTLWHYLPDYDYRPDLFEYTEFHTTDPDYVVLDVSMMVASPQHSQHLGHMERSLLILVESCEPPIHVMRDAGISGIPSHMVGSGRHTRTLGPDLAVWAGTAQRNLPLSYRYSQYGVPLLVVEVISHSTAQMRANDWEHKMQAYARMGIGEYWLLDDRQDSPLCGYTLDAADAGAGQLTEYRRMIVSADGGQASRVLGTSLRWVDDYLEGWKPEWGGWVRVLDIPSLEAAQEADARGREGRAEGRAEGAVTAELAACLDLLLAMGVSFDDSRELGLDLLCLDTVPGVGALMRTQGDRGQLRRYIPLRPPDHTTAEDDRYVTALLRACPTYRLNDYTGPG